MNNVTRLERQIAKALGVTVNGLDVLRRLNRGDDISGNNTGTMLDRLELTEPPIYEPKPHGGWSLRRPRQLTDKGRDILRRARELGF
jgi:hypothetical protein